MVIGAIIGAVAGGVAKIVVQHNRNKAIEGAVSRQVRAAEIRQQQIIQQGEIARLSRLRAAHQLAQRVRVGAAESGTTEASFANLDRQVAFDASIDLDILKQQLTFNLRQNRQQAILNLEQLAAQGTNLHAAGVTGGAQGFSTGLQIQNQLDQNRANQQSLNTSGNVRGPTQTGQFSGNE